MSESVTFFRHSIEAFGYDKARELGATIITALAESHDSVPMLSPVCGLRLMVLDQDMHAFADTSTDVIDICFDVREDIDTTIDLTPFAIRHEVAHIAHAQQQPNLKSHYNVNEYLWEGVVMEGIASHVEMSLLPDYDPAYISRTGVYDDALVRKIEDGLIDVLYAPGENQASRYYDFIKGDETFPLRGYELGLYVVANYVAQSGVDLLQLMKVTPTEFREFAETQL